MENLEILKCFACVFLTLSQEIVLCPNPHRNWDNFRIRTRVLVEENCRFVHLGLKKMNVPILKNVVF